MPKSPLLDKMKYGGTALGLFVHEPDMIELCGYLGFDYFFVDQMFSANDWSRTEALIRAGEAAGITPVVRIQSNPWSGYDSHLPVEMSRALGVGAQFVGVSISTKREVEECLRVGEDWHRKVFTIHYANSYDDWAAQKEQRTKETYIIPMIETAEALGQIDEIIQMPNVKIVRIAMTDGSRILSGQEKPDWNHPKIWDLIDHAVELGRKHGVAIGSNTSYAYSMEELQMRIARLHEHGVRMILCQGSHFLFQVAMTEFLKPLRGILKMPTVPGAGA